jgi:hypothetical protein
MSLTPLMLESLAPSGVDWAKLSEISQTYSAISIPLSGVALIGVVFSLSYQSRQLNAASEEAARSAHRELVLRTFDDPHFLVCWEPPVSPMSELRLKQYGFVNLIISQWRADFLSGRLNGVTLRIVALRVFRGEVPREFWSICGLGWRETMSTQGRKYSKFAEIVDSAYVAALAEGPPVPASRYVMLDGDPAGEPS